MLFKGPDLFGRQAIARANSHEWKFSATGSLRPRVIVNGNKDLLCGRLTIDPSFKTDRAADLLTVLGIYLDG